MNSTFYGSPDVKKMNLNKWVESQSDYKKKKKLAMLFRTVAFVVLLICILLPVLLLMIWEELRLQVSSKMVLLK